MNKDTKEILLNEYFASKDRSEQKQDRLITKLEKHIAKEPDTELLLALLDLKTINANISQQSFADRCAIALPIFEELENALEWGYLQLHVLSVVIANHPDFNKTLWFFQKAVDTINHKYADTPGFKSIATSLHYNFTVRILRAKYKDPNVDNKKLKALFEHSYNHVMDVCVRHDLPLQYTLQVIRGVFNNKIELIEQGLAKLKELGEKQRYANAKSEIVEFLWYMNDISKELTSFVIGYQIRKRRKEMNMDAFDLAIELDTDDNAIMSIERGDDGVSIYRLIKLAKILKVNMSYFFGDEGGKSEDTNSFATKINIYMGGATESDKEFVLNHAKMYMESKYPNRGKKK